jgi:hypothetical protein
MSRDEGPGDLLDPALRDEIELVSDLVVAASAATRHFTPAEVDALLGLVPDECVTPEGPRAEQGPGQLEGSAEASG